MCQPPMPFVGGIWRSHANRETSMSWKQERQHGVSEAWVTHQAADPACWLREQPSYLTSAFALKAVMSFLLRWQGLLLFSFRKLINEEMNLYSQTRCSSLNIKNRTSQPKDRREEKESTVNHRLLIPCHKTLFSPAMIPSGVYEGGYRDHTVYCNIWQ